ncbi:hypothetical protein GJ496_010560 [Pomphorhynchus laevis]|nr:hypothetical protein GJ496_010560 [Pomphorhynchus laevis]
MCGLYYVVLSSLLIYPIFNLESSQIFKEFAEVQLLLVKPYLKLTNKDFNHVFTASITARYAANLEPVPFRINRFPGHVDAQCSNNVNHSYPCEIVDLSKALFRNKNTGTYQVLNLQDVQFNINPFDKYVVIELLNDQMPGPFYLNFMHSGTVWKQLTELNFKRDSVSITLWAYISNQLEMAYEPPENVRLVINDIKPNMLNGIAESKPMCKLQSLSNTIGMYKDHDLHYYMLPKWVSGSTTEVMPILRMEYMYKTITYVEFKVEFSNSITGYFYDILRMSMPPQSMFPGGNAIIKRNGLLSDTQLLNSYVNYDSTNYSSYDVMSSVNTDVIYIRQALPVPVKAAGELSREQYDANSIYISMTVNNTGLKAVEHIIIKEIFGPNVVPKVVTNESLPSYYVNDDNTELTFELSLAPKMSIDFHYIIQLS